MPASLISHVRAMERQIVGDMERVFGFLSFHTHFQTIIYRYLKLNVKTTSDLCKIPCSAPHDRTKCIMVPY